MSLCHDCPHQGTVAKGNGAFVDKAHPCHNDVETPCKGHLRDLHNVRTGKAIYSGDEVNQTYSLSIEGGKPIQFRNELDHSEIKSLREFLKSHHGAINVRV